MQVPSVDLLAPGGVQARPVVKEVLAAIQLVSFLVGGRDGARLLRGVKHRDARRVAPWDRTEREREDALQGVADRLGLSQRPGQVGERLDKIPVPLGQLRGWRFVVCH